MGQVKKRSEMQEEFKRKKIETSIKSAGADENMARKISDKIEFKTGLKTSDVRKQVIKKLTEYDGKVTKAYESYKKPVAVKN